MKHDPKLEWCSCGYHFYPGLYEKIIMLLHGEYRKRCPRCGTVMVLHLSHFVYVKERKVTRNKEIWEKG